MNGKVDAAEALLGALFAIVSVFSLTAVALAEAGAFTRTSVLIAGAVASIVVLVWIRRTTAAHGGVAPTSPRDWTMLACVFAASIALLLPPMEAVVDAGDSSVYLAIARFIADEHSLRPVDPEVASIAPDLREQLFSRDPTPPTLFNYFPGGLQVTDDARLEASFFHLAPIWMAVFDSVGGPRSAPFVGLFFAVLSIPIAWAIGRRLSGPWTGIAAAALIVANFGEQYFARWPCSEIVAQYFALAAVWWLTLANDDDRSIWAPLAAGTAVGLGAFARVDSLLMTALPVLAALAVLALIERPGRRARVIALAAGVVVTSYAVLHHWNFAHAYASRVLRAMTFIKYRYPRFVWGSLAGAFALGLLYVAYARGSAFLRRTAIVVVGLGAVGVLIAGTARAMHSVLETLLTGPGIAIVFAGLAALLVRQPIARVMPLAIVFLGSAVLYLQHRVDITGALIALRRAVPVLLPLGAILMAVALATLARAGAAARWLAIAGVVVFVAVFGWRSRVVFASHLFGGSYDNVAAIARTLPERALIIADPQTASHLALALRFDFHRSVLLVSGQADDGALVRVSQQAAAQHRPVLLLVPSSHEPRSLMPGQFAPMTIRALDQSSLPITQIDQMSADLPGRLVNATREIETYAIEPPTRAPIPIVMNLGPRDFAFAGLGWNPAETMQDVSARWTDGAAQLIVPVVDHPPDRVTIVVTAAGTRPPGLAVPTVQLSIGDLMLGTFVVNRSGFADYRLALSPEQTAALCRGGSLLMRSDAFVPARISNADDRRRLGIAVDRVVIDR